MLTIQCEGDRVDIPLAAFLPAPNITFDSLVNLGKVVLEGSASAIVELANEGWREARWSVDFGDDSPVSASPSSGVLAPKGKFVDNDGDGMMEADRGEYVVGAAGEWTCKVRITFSGDTLGDFRGLGKVLVEGYGAKTIDVSATVVEQRLSLLLPEGGGPLTQAHFGALYFGEKREIKALLVNSGPVPCAFNAALADRFDVNASTGAVVGYINGSTETVIPGKTVPPADQVCVCVCDV